MKTFLALLSLISIPLSLGIIPSLISVKYGGGNGVLAFLLVISFWMIIIVVTGTETDTWYE